MVACPDVLSDETMERSKAEDLSFGYDEGNMLCIKPDNAATS